MDDVALANLIAGLSSSPVEVGRIPLSLAKRIGAKTRVVLLSRYTLTKQSFRHRDVLFSHYQILPAVFSAGSIIHDKRRSPGRLIFLYKETERFGRYFRAVVKATRSGDELYLDSYHKIWSGEFARLHKRAKKEKALLRP